MYMRKMKMFSFRLSTQDNDRFREFCNNMDISMSAFLSSFVKFIINEKREPPIYITALLNHRGYFKKDINEQ